MFIPYRRATLLIPSGPATDLARNHLFILLTNPVGDDGEVAIVGIASRTQHADQTCLLYASDHSFIRHE